MRESLSCPWNFKIKCNGERCPLKDDAFSDLLERWVFQGRTPWSASMERGCRNPRASENQALSKAAISRLFEYPERAEWFIAHGHMARSICQDLKRARFLWKETEKGISLRRARQLWSREST